jgi:hypothetical protein
MRGKRHYRTATPEQRQIPTSMPIYTFGLDPQTDRGLLNDFFEAIKTSAAAYTVHLRTLTAEQIHNLALHPALTSLGLSSQPSMLVTEQTMLIAIVAAVLSRYIFTHTVSSHALRLSNHPHANYTDELLHQWDLLSADNDYYEKANELLYHQSYIYTAIKILPTHKAWRATAAHTLTACLLHDLQRPPSHRSFARSAQRAQLHLVRDFRQRVQDWVSAAHERREVAVRVACVWR